MTATQEAVYRRALQYSRTLRIGDVFTIDGNDTVVGRRAKVAGRAKSVLYFRVAKSVVFARDGYGNLSVATYEDLAGRVGLPDALAEAGI